MTYKENKLRAKKREWIIDFIDIKNTALNFAYGHGDIEAAHKIEEEIENLRCIYEKS